MIQLRMKISKSRLLPSDKRGSPGSSTRRLSKLQLLLLSCPWGPCRPPGRRQRPLWGRAFQNWSSRPCRPRRWSRGYPLIFWSFRSLETWEVVSVFHTIPCSSRTVSGKQIWIRWQTLKLTLQSGRQVHNSVFCSPLSALCSQRPGKCFFFKA